MAKGKHISEDEIKYIVDVESSKAQQEIRKLEKSTGDLRAENKRRLDQLIRLEAAGKKQSQQYRDLRKRYNEVNQEIKHNTQEMARLTSGIKVTDLTMNQLKKQAKQLQRQLDDTSKSLNPEAYEQVQQRLALVNGRMLELKETAKGLKEDLLDDNTMGFLKGTMVVKAAEVIGGVFRKVAGSIHGFVSEVISDSVELAESADGITHAFDALDNPGLLDNLRKATKGTVNDVELMKAAVKAKDFRIPLDDLGKYLEFAQLKAQQTGESLDYMVDSIVTGLGRQSPQILDNLGLSASEIKEQTKQTGDFMKAVANIVEKNLAAAGENYISAADRAAQRTTALQNAQRELGQELLPIKERVTDIYGQWQLSIINVMKYFLQHKSQVLTFVKVLGVLTATYTAYIAGQKLSWLWSQREIAAGKLKAARLAVENTLLQMSALRHAVLNGTMTKTIALQKALNLVLKLSPWGLVAGAIMLVVSSLILFNRRTDEAARAQKMLNTIKQDAIAKCQEEKTKIELLVAAARDETLSLGERKKAINALNEIIPSYNAQLDETTGRYRENKKALDDYLNSLVRKYEIEGAKEMLAQLGKEAAEAQVKLDKAKKALEEAKSAGAGYTYTTSWGAVGNTTQDLTAKRQGDLNQAQAAVNSVQRRQQAILDSYGKALQQDAVNAATEDIRRTNPTNSTSKGSGGSRGGNAPDPDEVLSKEYDEARKKSLKDWQSFYEQREFLLNEALARQQMSQQEYNYKMSQLQLLNAETILAIENTYYEQSDALGFKDAEKKKAFRARYLEFVETADRNSQEARLNAERAFQGSLDKIEEFAAKEKPKTLEQERDAQLEILKGYYEASLQYATQDAERLQQVETAYGEAKARIVRDYEEKAAKQRLQVRQQYGLVKEQEQHELELAELKRQLNDKILSLEEYNQAVAAKEKEYADKRKQQRVQLGVERQNEYQQQLDQLKAALDQQLITQEEYEQRAKQIKMDSWKQQFDYYSQLFGGAMKALQDAEMANIDAKYDAEIEAARGNAEKVEELENKKANEKLKVQKKYADVNFAIQASQIIANTAVSIMKALSELGPIAGPIAAALMGVTGAAQLAAANAERQKVKKMTLSGSAGSTSVQGTRVATGLEEGGYADVERRQDGKRFHARLDPDRRGYVDRPTVIVGEGPSGHSREWVASNAALQNPTVAPLIDIIDRAQRVGNISTLDMRKYLLAQQVRGLQSGGSVSPSATPVPYAATSSQPADDTLLQRLCTLLSRLEAEGIPAFVALDEFDAKQQMRNQSRKIGSK